MKAIIPPSLCPMIPVLEGSISSRFLRYSNAALASVALSAEVAPALHAEKLKRKRKEEERKAAEVRSQRQFHELSGIPLHNID